MTESDRLSPDEISTDSVAPEPVCIAANDAAPGAPRHAGELLSARRIARGMTIQEMATRLKLSVKALERLESGEHEKLGQPSVVRGFVRAYARALELDPAEVLPLLPDVPNPVAALTLEPTLSAPLPSGMSRGSTEWWLRGLAVAALIVAAAITLGRYGLGPVRALLEQHESATPLAVHQPIATPEPVVVAAIAPVVQPTIAAAPDEVARDASSRPSSLTPGAQMASTVSALVAPAANAAAWGEGALRIHVQSESWLEVSDANGKVLVSALQPMGSRQALNGRPPFTLVIGNAPGVQVEYLGKAVDLGPYTRGNVARVVVN